MLPSNIRSCAYEVPPIHTDPMFHDIVLPIHTVVKLHDIILPIHSDLMFHDTVPSIHRNPVFHDTAGKIHCAVLCPTSFYVFNVTCMTVLCKDSVLD